jgi:hypothetical protein
MSRARSLEHCTLRELMMWRDHPSMLPLAEPQLARWLSPFGRFALDVDELSRQAAVPLRMNSS